MPRYGRGDDVYGRHGVALALVPQDREPVVGEVGLVIERHA